MKKVNFYDWDLKLFIREQALEQLLCMFPSVQFNVIDIIRIAATNRRFQRALTKFEEPQQSMNNKASKNRIYTFVLEGTADAPSIGFKS